jgi:hypothetical protein
VENWQEQGYTMAKRKGAGRKSDTELTIGTGGETHQTASGENRADLFQRKGEKVPVFVRFSTVAGSKGSPDLARDVRGFAVKFYTKQGNWDLVGNNIPVFFIQDAIKFPDLIHAAKPEPDSAFPQAQTAHDNFWDFISLSPESMHMVMWIMSDRTLPRSFRLIRCCKGATFRISTRRSNGWAARTSRTFRSTPRNARSRISSRTAIWPCTTLPAGPTTSRTPGATWAARVSRPMLAITDASK